MYVQSIRGSIGTAIGHTRLTTSGSFPKIGMPRQSRSCALSNRPGRMTDLETRPQSYAEAMAHSLTSEAAVCK